MALPVKDGNVEGLTVHGSREAPLKLPHSDRALIATEKVLGYLLSPTHPTGGAKAKFFFGLGFTPERCLILVAGLRRIAQEGVVVETVGTAYGTKYVVSGTLHPPSGRAVRLTTIWIVLKGELFPRFVTAYPEHY